MQTIAQQTQIYQGSALQSALQTRLGSEDSGLELTSEQLAVLMRLISESETALISSKPTTTTGKARKRAKSAYQFWKSDEEVKAKFREDHPDSDGPTTNRLMGQHWKALSEEDRVPYQEMSDKDKLEFESNSGAVSPKPSGKKEKVRKRARSGYQLFKSDEEVKARVRSANPDADFATFSKALSTEWSSLSDEEKEPFLEKAKAEKVLFESSKASGSDDQQADSD